MKLIQKPAGHALKIKLVIFLWIVFCNLIIQGFHHQLESWGMAAWNMFLVNVLFFMMEEEPYKERWIKCFSGIIVGFAGVWGLCIINGALSAAGMPHLVAVMVPIVLFLALIIMGGAYCPMVFNSVGFAYFLVGLISPEVTFVHLGTYMLGGILGNLLINGGAILIIQALINHFKAKAAKKQQ